MISKKTDDDVTLFKTIVRTLNELNTVMNLTWEDSKCSACNYEGMCDENNDCVEGMSEYVYKKIKGEIL